MSPSDDVELALLARVIECQLYNPDGNDRFLHRGVAAGQELAAWLKHLVNTQEGGAVVSDVAARLAAAYKAANPATRSRIETGG